MVFKTTAQLQAYLNQQLQDILSEEVKDKVVKEFQKNIGDVYKQYTPQEYSRRGYDGGLSDEENIQAEIEDGKLIVRNVAKPNKKGHVFNNMTALSQFITAGSPPLFGNVPARPFVEKTEEKLKEKEIVRKAVKQGLKTRGIKAK